MNSSGDTSTDHLDFVTLEGLLTYGEQLAQRSPTDGIVLPPSPAPSTDRRRRAEEATDKIRAFVHRVQAGLPTAEAYRAARAAVIAEDCGGDELVFFAAWNYLLARGELAPLYRAPIGAVQKPSHRRPVAIVPRAHLTPQLAEGRIVLDLGDDRFWLLPRDLTDRTLFFTMRHGVSQTESKTHRVGRRLANVLDAERGVPRADAVGAALAKMVGVVGQQLGYLHLHNYLDPHAFLHLISRSPNTEQLYRRITKALLPESPGPRTDRTSHNRTHIGIPGLRLGHRYGETGGSRGSGGTPWASTTRPPSASSNIPSTAIPEGTRSSISIST